MNLKSSNKINTNRYELEIEISAEEFEDAVNKAFLKNRKKISLPGFRKGKAPRTFIEKYYGENVFYEDAVNDTYPKALDDAIEEAKLDVINDKIDFDIVKIGKDGFVFKAAVTVKPEVEINNYKGLEISEKSCEATDEDVEKEIDAQREKSARFVEAKDRAAQNGDIVVIDFEGFADGVAFEGGMAENYSLSLGSNQFIPGFEDQIVGHKKDEEFDINVTFPEDYTAENLAGKPCVFKIKLHEIKEKELPVLDDEFIKDISEFDTLEEYKKDLKIKLSEKKEKESKDDFDNQIIDKIIDLIKAEIPEAMFENKINENLKDFADRLKSQGLDMPTYMKYTGLDEQTFKEQFRPMAERQVKLRLALEKVAEIESLTPNVEELENKFKEFSENYKIDIDKIKLMVPEKDLILDLSCEKALNFLRENAIKK